MRTSVGTLDPIRTLAPKMRNAGPCRGDDPAATDVSNQGEAMTQLDRTVWTAPVRNLVWVAAQFGHR